MLRASAEVTIFTGYIKIKWRVWVEEEAIASSNEKKGLDLEFFFFLRNLNDSRRDHEFQYLYVHSLNELCWEQLSQSSVSVDVDGIYVLLLNTRWRHASFPRVLADPFTGWHIMNNWEQAADHFSNNMMDNRIALFDRTKFSLYYLCRQAARCPYWLTWFKRLTPIICVSWSCSTDSSRSNWGNNSIIGVSCKGAGCHCPITSWLPFCSSSVSHRMTCFHRGEALFIIQCCIAKNWSSF